MKHGELIIKYIYEELFSKNALSAIPKIDVVMPMPSSEIMFCKRALHKYVHVYAYIHICKKLFAKTQSLNLALALQAHFFLEWRLTRFGKELFICSMRI